MDTECTEFARSFTEKILCASRRRGDLVRSTQEDDASRSWMLCRNKVRRHDGQESCSPSPNFSAFFAQETEKPAIGRNLRTCRTADPSRHDTTRSHSVGSMQVDVIPNRRSPPTSGGARTPTTAARSQTHAGRTSRPDRPNGLSSCAGLVAERSTSVCIRVHLWFHSLATSRSASRCGLRETARRVFRETEVLEPQMHSRGRDAHCCAPAAQIPACGFPAPGSCLG